MKGMTPLKAMLARHSTRLARHFLSLALALCLVAVAVYIGLWFGGELWTGESYPLEKPSTQPVYYPRNPPTSAISP